MSVTYRTEGAVAILTLDRPDVFNSVDLSITEGMQDGLRRAGEECRAAVITGAGRAFCAGADLGDLMEEYRTDGPDLRKVIDGRFNPIVQALIEAPVPTVAAVNGAAAGAGMGIALACDLRVMAEQAFFMSAFINVALIPDTGSAWMLPHMVGLSRAMEIAMTGRRVSSEEAKSLGLVTDVVPTDDVIDTAIERAAALAAGPTGALIETRRILRVAAAEALEHTLDDEAETQGRLGSRPNHLEGMNAFLEKRPPSWH